MERKKYFSKRNKNTTIGFDQVLEKFKTVYKILTDKDFFKELAGIYSDITPELIRNEASLRLSIQPFPIDRLDYWGTTTENLFDIIEFFYDYVSQPFGSVSKTTDTNWRFEDYEGYSKADGQTIYREYINMFLNDFEEGYELNSKGQIITIGRDGTELLYNVPTPEFDFENIEKIVQESIQRWRMRSLTLDERREVIKRLADVFEWLKKSKNLAAVLDKKDDKLIFEIVNGFDIRHHNPDQKTNYDKSIWYSWMFHFYLATYHAVIRLIQKSKQSST